MAEKNYKDWKIDDIIAWCVEHNEQDWLIAMGEKKITRKVYPKVESVSKKGKKSWKQDKTKEPTIEEVPISFVELKTAFIEKFIETTPKEKKLSMYDKIAALKNK